MRLRPAVRGSQVSCSLAQDLESECNPLRRQAVQQHSGICILESYVRCLPCLASNSRVRIPQQQNLLAAGRRPAGKLGR